MNSEHGYLISFFLILLYITSKASALCNRFCGQNKTQQFHHLPYPFGFSPDCEIQLNCSTTGEVYIQLQEFQIKNITSDNLILQLPANCNRPLETMSHLYNKTTRSHRKTLYY
ncbi:hypothetical protein IFM89_000057 [Coptis chinensis]|uniref:Wall-associated receptor kinase galacturonan-binding domain-containing protein n=1 Tax=Coptis chinensis TaxID=261450 RepID=A0A835M3B0_9MAGN|nr:hypothetical protein IFM89_000057 [Coptis chinensis]